MKPNVKPSVPEGSPNVICSIIELYTLGKRGCRIPIPVCP
jgi:hypothetical protein